MYFCPNRKARISSPPSDCSRFSLLSIFFSTSEKMFQVLFRDSRSWAISFPPARISAFGKRLLVQQKSSCQVPFLPAARPDSSEDSSLSFAFLSIRFPFSLSETVPPCSKKSECDLTHGAYCFHQRELPLPKVLSAYLSKVFLSGSFRSRKILPRIARISRTILTFTHREKRAVFCGAHMQR